MPELQFARLDRRIRLRHLTCFIEVARLGSSVKAATALGLSQPAVSKTIHELETALSAVLFEPKRRSMVLTSVGEVFLRYADSSITALKLGIRTVAQNSASEQATLTIGALPTVSARVLPLTLAELTKSMPSLRFRVVTGSNDVLMSQLRLGDIDLVVGRMASPEAMKGLAFEYLYSEPIVFAVRPDHPLLMGDGFSAIGIGTYQVLVPPPGSVIQSTVERFFMAHSLHASSEIQTVSDAFARNYLLRTDAIWVISEGVIAEDVAKGILKTLPVDTEETIGPVGLTTRTDTALPLPAHLFMTALRNAVDFRARSR
ncbi:pca operon transcription factor PcaQ [Bosea sp. 47.2.35]|jgi:LysR family pca operon transcriptional activator|uniref:pca operon transcription factor PcaQ n=1 Tax=Bosea sp. 47.2.35 TaxID=2969304 RepID=UPI00214F94DA|nr:pca operon transcription factor PcaQ [Bosea sp. 47.2.35]MCR4524617.1 pca operon transcription factor PcaQ [Bosea sp. 47.2.35]